MGNKIHYLADSCVLARLSVFFSAFEKMSYFYWTRGKLHLPHGKDLRGSDGGAGAGAVYKEAII